MPADCSLLMTRWRKITPVRPLLTSFSWYVPLCCRPLPVESPPLAVFLKVLGHAAVSLPYYVAWVLFAAWASPGIKQQQCKSLFSWLSAVYKWARFLKEICQGMIKPGEQIQPAMAFCSSGAPFQERTLMVSDYKEQNKDNPATK